MIKDKQTNQLYQMIRGMSDKISRCTGSKVLISCSIMDDKDHVVMVGGSKNNKCEDNLLAADGIMEAVDSMIDECDNC